MLTLLTLRLLPSRSPTRPPPPPPPRSRLRFPETRNDKGACLTVTEFDAQKEGGYFKIGAAPETLQKTNLGKLRVGDKVNCERAMAAHTRFGGHFVQVS